MRVEQGPEIRIRTTESGSASEAAARADVGKAGDVDFGALFAGTVEEANRLHQVATAKAEALAKGASDDLHGTMISVKEAEFSLKLVGSVRNRLLDAFHELWRINL